MSTLAKNQPLPPHIYLFVGQDSFSRAEKIAAWKNRFAEKYAASGITIVDCEEMGSGSISRSEFVPDPISLLKNALCSSTLFSHTSLVIIKNPFSKKAGPVRDLLCSLLPACCESTFVVLSDDARDARSELSKLLTALSKKGVCVIEEFNIPAGSMLKKWIVERAKKYGGQFDPRALSVFCAALEEQGGSDEDAFKISLWHLDNEIKKLASYSANKPIAVGDIEALSCLPRTAHIFNLSDALIAGTARTSFVHAHRLLGPYRSAMHAPLLRMTAFLMTQFRSFLMLKNMEEDRQTDAEIARVLSWNPKRVWVVKKKLSRHSTDSLKDAYTRLLGLERALKTGSADPLLSLDLFIKKTTE